VSAEMLAIVLSGVALLLSFVGMFVGGFARMLRRMDAGFDRVEARIDRLEAKLEARITAVEKEQVEVKVAVARIEGPPRHLLTVR